MDSLTINLSICPCRNLFCLPNEKVRPYALLCIIMRIGRRRCQRQSEKTSPPEDTQYHYYDFLAKHARRLSAPRRRCYSFPVSDHAAVSRSEESGASRTQARLDVAESIALHRDLGELFHDLSERLHRVAHFDFLILLLHDPVRQVMRLHILESLHPTEFRAGYEMPLNETPAGRVFETQQPYVINDVQADSPFPAVMEVLRRENVRSYCAVPLTTAQRRLGAIGFGKLEPHRYSEAEVEFMQQVARQVAVAVDNTLNFQAVQGYQQQLARERDLLRVLLDVNNAIASTLDLRELFQAITRSLRRVVHHEFTSLALYEPGAQKLRMLELDF